MEDANKIYTMGVWMVFPEHHPAFVKTWSDFAAWIAKHVPGAGKSFLLQNSERPNQFVSFGSWDENAEAWRQRNEFREFVSLLNQLCEEFYPNTMNLVATTPTN